MEVAVCICTYKRSELLDQLLTSLRDIELGALAPQDVCLIVVDNAADGAVRKVCDRHAERLPITLHCYEERQRGISFARNRAVAEALAKGAAHVAFIDDDDVPRRDWLRHLIENQRESGASLVFGFWEWPASVHADGALTRLVLQPPDFEGVSRYGLPNWAATCNVLIGRNVLVQLARDGQVFVPQLGRVGGEDVDFFIRASRHCGARYSKTRHSLVMRDWESGRKTLRGLLRWSYRTGVTRVCLDERHLPKHELRQLRRRRMKALIPLLQGLAGCLRMPAGERKPEAFRHLYRIFRWLGEMSAHAGFRSCYY